MPRTTRAVRENLSLIHAVESDDSIDNIRDLLERGIVNVDERDSLARTPLMIALDARNVELAELLLQHGADPNAVDEAGESVFAHSHSVVADALLRRYGSDEAERQMNSNNNNNNNNALSNNNNISNLPVRNIPRGSNSALMTNIAENDEMVNFHNEYKLGRYYTRANYNGLKAPKRNPMTRRNIGRNNVKRYRAHLVNKTGGVRKTRGRKLRR
jgi:ankyrin repeat protein